MVLYVAGCWVDVWWAEAAAANAVAACSDAKPGKVRVPLLLLLPVEAVEEEVVKGGGEAAPAAGVVVVAVAVAVGAGDGEAVAAAEEAEGAGAGAGDEGVGADLVSGGGTSLKHAKRGAIALLNIVLSSAEQRGT